MPCRSPWRGAGRYQILGEIARGGMGVVLKARDADLGRDLALKVLLSPGTATTPTRPPVRRGGADRRPAPASRDRAGLRAGTLADRRPFFAMKLVKGRTLAALLAERPDPTHDLPRFLAIFEQVCQTVAYAHARRVIHRDLKPSNVMVGSFGEVQVMDWGLAKVLAEGGVADEAKALRAAEETVILTARSGPAAAAASRSRAACWARPPYMAPEQARGEVERIDERADVFGLGRSSARSSPAGRRTPDRRGTRSAPGPRGRPGRRAGPARRLRGRRRLVALARDCLAAEPERRPRDAARWRGGCRPTGRRAGSARSGRAGAGRGADAGRGGAGAVSSGHDGG